MLPETYNAPLTDAFPATCKLPPSCILIFDPLVKSKSLFCATKPLSNVAEPLETTNAPVIDVSVLMLKPPKSDKDAVNAPLAILDKFNPVTPVAGIFVKLLPSPLNEPVKNEADTFVDTRLLIVTPLIVLPSILPVKSNAVLPPEANMYKVSLPTA